MNDELILLIEEFAAKCEVAKNHPAVIEILSNYRKAQRPSLISRIIDRCRAMLS